jgi:hypothetical protein
MNGTVAVLGCGPAGLLAAEAVGQCGYSVEIYSQKKKSPISGAQYLHEAIPGVTTSADAFAIEYQKLGDRAGYATKVYGHPDAPCSWDLFPEGTVLAYPLHVVYDRLWEKWSGAIRQAELTPEGVEELCAPHGDGFDYDRVISAVPLTAICQRLHQHKFAWANIYVTDHAWAGVAEDTIVYNGELSDHWYRSSRLWGHEYTESTIATPTSAPGRKPLWNTCDCHPRVLRVGRFGTWKKNKLVHHAYQEVKDALHAMQP